ncbi:MAG: YjbF family lipoprotein, partial [Rhizomicrobium sp.]
MRSRLLPLLAGLLLLSGCESSGVSDYTLYYQALRQDFAASLSGASRITRAEAAAIPYASLGYRLNDGPEQLLVLATDIGGEQLWTSARHVVLVTRNGRLVRTVGLTHDVSAVTPQRQQQLLPLVDVVDRPLRSVRLEDFPDLGFYGVPVTCVASSQGLQTIVILGEGISTRKVDEACRSDALDWSFTDSYWLDPEDGVVWRSIQHLS